MIRQISNVKPQDIVTTRSSELLVQVFIEDLYFILEEKWLCWYGHVECSNGADKRAFDIQVDAWAWEAQDDMKADDGEELQRFEALMIDIPGDLVWDLQCAQQSSFLEGDVEVASVPAH